MKLKRKRVYRATPTSIIFIFSAFAAATDCSARRDDRFEPPDPLLHVPEVSHTVDIATVHA